MEELLGFQNTITLTHSSTDSVFEEFKHLSVAVSDPGLLHDAGRCLPDHPAQTRHRQHSVKCHQLNYMGAS